jgi:hypothetical protein
MAETLLQGLAWLGLVACLALLLWQWLPSRRARQWRNGFDAARRRWRSRWRERRRHAEARREADAVIRRAQRNARRDRQAERPSQPKDSREPH